MRNPEFAAPNDRANRRAAAPRSGLTLAEVLVSMGILVIGLLGVAALFPVGGHYMQTGDIADRAGAIAQAALDDAVIRGHLDPENWIAVNVASSLNTFYPLVSGRDGYPGLRDDISESNTASVPAMVSKTSDVLYRSAKHGDAYVIDPLGIGATLAGAPNNGIVTSPAQSGAHANFPALIPIVSYSAPQWDPWYANGFTWPVRRVTTTHNTQLLNDSLAYKLNEPIAKATFAATDDVALILPGNGDDPSRGRWTTWRAGSATQAMPARRQARGDYSWLISVSPGSSEARDALATSPDAYQYDVSVVVFHKRVLGGGIDGARESERLVNAKVVTTSTAGGELLLERRATSEDPVNESPFEDLRENQYVMLTGPHPLSTSARPMLFLQWYRVLAIEDSGSPELAGLSSPNNRLDRDDRVLVSLRGPDWPWRPVQGSNGGLDDPTLLPNDLRVAILPGAVAVHTKTMRLEAGTPWSID